ncbi:MAG: rod shape-determining protein MreC [Patescibacteria group bacterium]
MTSYRSNYLKYVGIILVIVLSLFFLRSHIWDYLLIFLQPIAGAPVFIGYSIGDSVIDQYNDLFSKLSSSDQIKALKEKITKLATDESKLRNLILENSELRKELDLLASYNFRSTGVEIIGRRQTVSTITYAINKGAFHGLKVGMPVIVQGIIVGRIIEIQKMFAEVALTTSPLLLTNAEVLNDDMSRGIIQGEFNLAIKINYIPTSDHLEINQNVITSGLDELVPRGLVIGQIASVNINEGDFFQSAVVVPPIDLSKLHFLRVIISVNDLN